MKIGNIDIPGVAGLAPMAGVTDRAFRDICVANGAAWTVTEMVSAKGLTYGDRKSDELLELDDSARPTAIQLFGDDPTIMADAARLAMKHRPDWIDINMGCPAPKIAGNHCGSALMRDPELCRRLVAAVAEAVPVPVTVKIRKGYSPSEVNAVEVAQACEAGGAAAIAVHGRTRGQMYAPPVDWEIIRAVKQAVNVPVIGNGDVTDGPSAAAMLAETGCDGVLVGRGALGNPWVFADIHAWLTEERRVPTPPVTARLLTLLKQTQNAISHKGEKVAMLEARKHAAWYMHGLTGAAAYRRQACAMTTFDDLVALCKQVEQEQG
ncbi:MAG: tRNA dihydrouridine synthase DusB [Clostridia bacterium]|nr:tRNA dihydrouridine synthase DusB [Clostridia bacterium]